MSELTKNRVLMFCMMCFITVSTVTEYIFVEVYHEPLKGLISGLILATIVTAIFFPFVRKILLKQQKEKEERQRQKREKEVMDMYSRKFEEPDYGEVEKTE